MAKIHIKIFLLVLFPYLIIAQSNNLPELDKIEFSGNEYFSDSDLMDVIALRETPSSFSQFMNNVFGLGEEAVYFDSLTVNEEIQRLKSFYFNNGFFETKISAKIEMDSENNRASVLFIVDEKSPTFLKNISVHGIESLADDEKSEIKSFLEIDSSNQFSSSQLKSINNDILVFLHNNGYMLSRIDSTIIFIDTVSSSINTDIYVETGNRFSISDIVVKKSGEGKDEVDDSLIREIVGVKKGEKYNQFKIQRGQSRLYKTNLFTTASVKTIPNDSLYSKNITPLVINTEIGRMYEISPEVIMNNEDNRFNLGLGAGFSKKNFFGGARVLTLNASIAAQNILEFISNLAVSDTSVIGYADLRLIMEQPFLFGKNIRTRYELYSTLQKRRNEYNTTALGFKVSLDFELPQKVYFTSFGTSWNFENLNVLYVESYLKRIFSNVLFNNTDLDSTQVDSASAVLASNISKSAKSNNTLLAFNLGANKTNDFGFPTSGYKLNILLGNANFLRYAATSIAQSQLNVPLYYKVQVDYSVFPNIYHSKENAFGLKFRIGNIQVYDGLESSVPYNQRFTSGGSNSIRGWQSRELVPNFKISNLDINSISPADLESIFLDQATPGGLFILEGSIETRNRLFGKVGSAIFLDYGNTWQNAKSFRFDQVAVSTGFGVRYYTDFIPFRLDFGIKLYDPKSGVPLMKRYFFKDLLQIHFAIGEAF